ncbi:MAG: DPP IV N-terminal domain-containing protein, partial [Peptococcaceae bacterium]|nr:DPP IV N-terminal domain-containing protein [Peptococcaceae bacterium]
KLLTMEETILSRDLTPKNIYCNWISPDEIAMFKDGNFVIFDISTRMERPYMPARAKAQEIVFTEGKSLYRRTKAGDTLTIAKSDNPDITYGQFVSRNEFGIQDGIFWSPDSSMVAFYRKDESRVSSFPLLDITTRTGSLKEIKYPMAGMDSENVQIGVYDLITGKTVYLKIEDFGYDRYLTNVTWTPDGTNILVQDNSRQKRRQTKSGGLKSECTSEMGIASSYTQK